MTTEATPIQPILFTRMNRFAIENAIVLFVRTEFDADYAFTRFREAVSEWVKIYTNGRNLAAFSHQDLNIGDLAGHNAFQDADLLEMMRAAGVEYVACYGISGDQCQDYDRVLMDRISEIDEGSVPVVTDAASAPIRLTGNFGEWLKDAVFYRNNVNLVTIFDGRFPELPASEELQAGDPRDYVSSMLDLSYLAAYQRDETLGIMLEVPVGYEKGISAEDFATLVNRQQSKLERLQLQYPPFAFSVAHGAATKDGCLYLRAFVPLDADHKLEACERFLVLAVQDDLLLTALDATQPTQAVPA